MPCFSCIYIIYLATELFHAKEQKKEGPLAAPV